jgi:hypothetical protein
VEETITGTRVVLTSAIRRDSLILFYEPNQELPVQGAVYFRLDHQTYAMHDGVIAIQDWQLDGVVSGHFEGKLRDLQNPLNGIDTRAGGTFWVDLSE